MKFKAFGNGLLSYTFLTIGLGISALGWAGFIIPSKIIAGGLTGIATVLHFLTGFDIGLMTLIMNTILIVTSMKVIGASFGVKSIYSVAVFSLFLSIITHLVSEPLITDRIMATVTGGVLAGTGAGIVFLNGGSTGGSDIIALMINKYKNISLGRLLLYIDAVVIGSSFILFRSLETMIFGFVTMAILAYTVDLIISGTKQTVQFFIFSDHYEEIKHQVINVAKRGITVIPAEGGYSGKEVKVLMVIARKSESQAILKIIKEADPRAFITMGNVMGVFGQGFDSIKV